MVVRWVIVSQRPLIAQVEMSLLICDLIPCAELTGARKLSSFEPLLRLNLLKVICVTWMRCPPSLWGQLTLTLHIMLNCIVPAFYYSFWLYQQQSQLKGEWENKCQACLGELNISDSFFNLICASRRLECKEGREAIIDPAGKEHVTDRFGPW